LHRHYFERGRRFPEDPIFTASMELGTAAESFSSQECTFWGWQSDIRRSRVLPKSVRIPPRISGHFVRYRHSMPDSDKTHGNSVHWIVCRKTCGFPAFTYASIIGRFSVFG
jgi:hypothetical protein